MTLLLGIAVLLVAWTLAVFSVVPYGGQVGTYVIIAVLLTLGFILYLGVRFVQGILWFFRKPPARKSRDDERMQEAVATQPADISERQAVERGARMRPAIKLLNFLVIAALLAIAFPMAFVTVHKLIEKGQSPEAARAKSTETLKRLKDRNEL